MSVLSVSRLTKRFGPPTGGFTAVNEISFEMKEGEVLGLLGPNGAGKTTTIQMLLGITTPTEGTITYFGRDFFRNKPDCLQRINYTSAFNTLQGRTTVWENLLVFSNLYQISDPEKKIMELIEYFEMSDLLHKRYWDLSAGQRTRTNFMKALLNDPQIILMDEPTASLDPDIADKTLTLIEQLRKDRKLSILFTSHNMPEVTRICDRVIFLDGLSFKKYVCNDLFKLI
jgi:ABC-2 type transport system ATP-binding protein